MSDCQDNLVVLRDLPVRRALTPLVGQQEAAQFAFQAVDLYDWPPRQAASWSAVTGSRAFWSTTSRFSRRRRPSAEWVSNPELFASPGNRAVPVTLLRRGSQRISSSCRRGQVNRFGQREERICGELLDMRKDP
jgi:hypothetical protein